SDDDFRTAGVLEFPDHVLNTSTTTALNLQFAVTDSGGTPVVVPNTKAGAYDINWFSFNVVPEPSTWAALVLVLPLLRRRTRA
ncbi:MAG TPA: hypothetical protein VIY86_07520, partial [Pirellulaceae bacterium]